MPEKSLTIPASEQMAIPIVDDKSLVGESKVCVQVAHCLVSCPAA